MRKDRARPQRPKRRKTVAEAPRRKSRVVLGVIALVILGGLVWVIHWRAAGPGLGGAATAPRQFNVLLIMVDTLRADRLGCYGSTRGATPNIDALAAASTRFAHAYAHAPWTLPSFASLLTSLPPPQHGAGGWVGQFRALAPGVPTVAECFRAAGYATASVVNVDFLGHEFGTTRGFTDVDFEAYPDNVRMRRATQTTAAATKWLRVPQHRPFFLMVHYFDPHLVYDPPPEYRRRFAAPQDQNDTQWVFGTRQQIVAYRRGLITFDPATIQRAEQLYNGEVAYTDHEVGCLLNELADLKLTNSTIVVFAADHGEEFLDHGGFEHGHSLYNEIVHVPLLIHLPSQSKPAVVRSAVGLVDVAPTLCALTGVPPAPDFVGQNLVPALEGGELAERPLVMEGNFWGPPLRGWLQGGYKLIDGPQGVHLFNLGVDPAERDDLALAEPERARRMLADMNLAFSEMQAQGPASAPSVGLSPEAIERLRSLGYIK